MSLVLRMVRKAIKQSNLNKSVLRSPLQSNNSVIAAHVGIIVVYTVLSIFVFNIKATDGEDGEIVHCRWKSAWTFVGGIADLYISCTIWVVTDEN